MVLIQEMVAVHVNAIQTAPTTRDALKGQVSVAVSLVLGDDPVMSVLMDTTSFPAVDVCVSTSSECNNRNLKI